jgi:MFS family permease
MLGERELFHLPLCAQGHDEILTSNTANATMTGLVTAIYDIGCAVGAVSAFIFGERLGRRRSIIVAQCIGTAHTCWSLAS